MNRIGSLAAVAAIVSVIVACSSGGDDADDLARIQAALPPGVPVDGILTFAKDEQVELFRDGVIDFADYESATLAMTRCMEEAGAVVVSAPTWDEAEQKFIFGFIDPPGGPEVTSGCVRGHVGFVKVAWEWRNGPSESEKQVAREALGECLRAADYAQVVGAPTEQEFTALIGDDASAGDALACLAEVKEATGVYPF